MSAIWQNNLHKLKQFKSKFGHTNVPKSYEDRQLARLVTTLRQQKRYGILKAERELSLHQLGFEFEPLQSQWLSIYKKVVEFYRLNGHASPNRRSENEHERALADWVHRMHKLVRKKTLDTDKIHKLSLINIDESPSNHRLSKKGLPLRFETMLSRLTHHIHQYSDLIHPNMTDQSLYQWVLLQQHRINAALITPKEYSSLLSTGFRFDSANLMSDGMLYG